MHALVCGYVSKIEGLTWKLSHKWLNDPPNDLQRNQMTSFSKFLNETPRAVYHIHSPGTPTCCLCLSCHFPNTRLNESQTWGLGSLTLLCTVGGCPMELVPPSPTFIPLFVSISSPSTTFLPRLPSPAPPVKQLGVGWPRVFLNSCFPKAKSNTF